MSVLTYSQLLAGCGNISFFLFSAHATTFVVVSCIDMCTVCFFKFQQCRWISCNKSNIQLYSFQLLVFQNISTKQGENPNKHCIETRSGCNFFFDFTFLLKLVLLVLEYPMYSKQQKRVDPWLRTSTTRSPAARATNFCRAFFYSRIPKLQFCNIY